MEEVLKSKQTYAATATSGPSIPAVSLHVPRDARNNPGQPLPIVDHNRVIPGTWAQRANVNVTSKDGAVGTNSGGAINDADPDQHRGTGGQPFREQQYQQVRPRRMRRTRPAAVFGEAETPEGTEVAAGLQKHELFVFQITNTVSEDNVKAYIEQKDVKVASIKRVSSEDAPSCSYHVVIHCMDVRTVMTPQFWPKGVGCRKFYTRKKQSWTER